MSNDIYDLPNTTELYMYGGASTSDQSHYDQIQAQDTDELYNHTHHNIGNITAEYSTISDADTSNEGLVYSAVVVKDGKKTTVKTIVHN